MNIEFKGDMQSPKTYFESMTKCTKYLISLVSIRKWTLHPDGKSESYSLWFKQRSYGYCHMIKRGIHELGYTDINGLKLGWLHFPLRKKAGSNSFPSKIILNYQRLNLENIFIWYPILIKVGEKTCREWEQSWIK